MSKSNDFIMGVPVLPIEGMAPFTPYKGSIQVAADCCGRVVWQGPAQQLFKAQHPDAQVICALCLAKDIAQSGEMPVFNQLTNKGEGD